jgi:hypothetical protein
VAALSEELLKLNLPLTAEALSNFKQIRSVQYDLYELGLYEENDQVTDAMDALSELYPEYARELTIPADEVSHALWAMETMGDISASDVVGLDSEGQRQYLERILFEDYEGDSDFDRVFSDGGMELTLSDFYAHS